MRAVMHVEGQARLEIVVDAAVCEYIDGHCGEIDVCIKTALGQLNGPDNAAVSLMTGFSADELDALGGLSE